MKKEVNLNELKEIIELFNSTNIKKLSIEENNYKLQIEQDIEIEISSFINQKQILEKEYVIITSQTVGQLRYIKELKYAKVNVGDILATIECMKLKNDILSPVDGIIRKVFVNKNEVVDFNQILMKIEIAS